MSEQPKNNREEELQEADGPIETSEEKLQKKVAIIDAALEQEGYHREPAKTQNPHSIPHPQHIN